MVTSQDIIKYRTKYGLTQTAFGALVGRKTRQVQKWEIDSPPMPDELWRLLMLEGGKNGKRKK